MCVYICMYIHIYIYPKCIRDDVPNDRYIPHESQHLFFKRPIWSVFSDGIIPSSYWKISLGTRHKPPVATKENHQLPPTSTRLWQDYGKRVVFLLFGAWRILPFSS